MTPNLFICYLKTCLQTICKINTICLNDTKHIISKVHNIFKNTHVLNLKIEDFLKN